MLHRVDRTGGGDDPVAGLAESRRSHADAGPCLWTARNFASTMLKDFGVETDVLSAGDHEAG